MRSNEINIYGTEHFINIADGQIVRVIKQIKGNHWYYPHHQDAN
jgi:3-hydroxymyristoyl/3-hydroxydecanoyl-(acyl carrier protein) dehydratase